AARPADGALRRPRLRHRPADRLGSRCRHAGAAGLPDGRRSENGVTAVAVAAAVALLVLANVLNNRLAPHWYLLTSLGTTALLLGLYAWAGAPWADAWLCGRVLRGAVWGLVLVALVALVYLVAALLPATR